MTETTMNPSAADAVSVFYDHPAEQAVLGAMLLDPALIPEIEELLTPESFHRPPHQLVFRTLTELRHDNQATDAISVAGHLVDAGKARQLPGGAVYLHELVSQVGIAAPHQALHYARVVADKALLRDLYAGLGSIREAIRSGGAGSPAELLERARTMISDLGLRAAVGDNGPVRWKDMIKDGLDAIEQAAEGSGPPGIPTGIHDLDRLIHGLRKQRLIVVAGLPGSGKSTLGAGDFVRSAAFHHRVPTALFSLEMTNLEIFNRLVCAEAGVPAQKVASGNLSDEDWTAIARMCGTTEDAPLWIDDTKGLTMADIRVRARRLKAQHDIQLIVIDYLGLIECRDGDSRHQQVDRLARSAKLLAGELNVPVVLLSQMNRNYAQRTDKRPLLSDLKESGGIEAHADVVVFVHREEMYDPTKRIGEADLIVRKNRGGANGTVEVAAQMHLNRFVSMAVPEEDD